MDSADVVVVGDRCGALFDHVAGVDLVLEEEGRDAGLGFAVHYGPVDGRGAAVLGQQTAVEVERPEPRHGPDSLWEHSERYHNEEVGVDIPQLVNEFRAFQFFGLENGQSFGYGIFLDVAFEQLMAAAGDFVGHRDDGGHVEALGDKAVETRHGELGRAEKDYSEI